MNDRDRAFFGQDDEPTDQIGTIDAKTPRRLRPKLRGRAGRLIEQLRKDEAIAEADTLLLTIPNQLGVAYNVHIMESILTPSLRPSAGGECFSHCPRHRGPFRKISLFSRWHYL
jgi:hypothetical protein